MTVYRSLPCALLALPLLCVAEGDPLESLQKTTSDLVKVRVETERLDSDWTSEKELLLSTTAALEQRAKDLELALALQTEKAGKNVEELARLREKNRLAQTSLDEADAELKALGEKILALRTSLPPRLASALELSFKSLSEAGLPAPDRTRLTMSVLTRCLQFDSSVTHSEEVLDIEGKSRALDVLYWGLSHAYAIDRSAKKAWYGAPSEGLWRWLPADDSFGSIARLMAIQAGREDPAFVSVPAKVARASEN